MTLHMTSTDMHELTLHKNEEHGVHENRENWRLSFHLVLYCQSSLLSPVDRSEVQGRANGPCK